MKQSNEIKVPEFLQQVNEENKKTTKFRNMDNQAMTQAEKEKIVSLISPMDDDQIDIVLSCISTDKMLEHIQKELHKNRAFVKAITEANDILQ